MTDVLAFFVVVLIDSVLKELKNKGEKSSLGGSKGKKFLRSNSFVLESFEGVLLFHVAWTSNHMSAYN